MSWYVYIPIVLFLLYLLVRAWRALRGAFVKTHCDICEFAFAPEEEKHRWEIDGQWATLCPRCNKKLENKIAAERFDAFFAEREDGADAPAPDAAPRREPIPAQVKREVWRRDGGACVECGSRELLEFDHIIPVSRGGANTVRNLQLLCERCNRLKSDQIQ